MSKWILAAGAAAIALTSPILAQPGGNKGGGGPKVEHGGGPKAAKVERGGGQMRQARVEAPRGGEHHAQAGGHHDVKSKAERRADVRGKDRAEQRGKEQVASRGNDRSQARGPDRALRDGVGTARNGNFFGRSANARDGKGLIDGCPPGLAMKNNGCLPPGQARKLVGAALPAAFGTNMLEGPFRNWYQDNDQYYYRNDGDTIYRVSRQGNLVDALIPYGAKDFDYYPVGMNYPVDYNFYNVPDQYRPYYADSTDSLYRYGNNAIYQLDPQTNAIQSIAALLAGDLAVGQPMPASYSMYNVPLAYRDRYYDSPDAMYRYNDGYIYRADPKTQLITAVIDAIV